MGISYYCFVAGILSPLGICAKRTKIILMAAVAIGPMIRRDIGGDHVCVLTFDRPESGANIFDAATLDELNEHLDFVENESSLRGLIITSAKKSIFIAGADLKTLLKQAQAGDLRAFIAEGQRILNPDDPSTRIGLPETTLGLIPAWGGCTRLPRLIGADKAADVILKGKLYSAQEALKLGLVDEVAPRDQLVDLARKKLRDGKRKPSPAPKIDQEIPAPRNHNPAPARALEVIKKGLFASTQQSLAFELDAIVDLGKTESTQNLIRNFFLAEKYKKGSAKIPMQKVVHAAVIGAGVMGSGIAQWLSSRGVTVILRDIAREQVDRGLANVEKTYADAVKRGLMSAEKAREGRARIVASTAPMELRDVQFVIEAASEKIEIKKEIFRELAMQAGPKTIVATNTSALPVSKLADATVSPEHVIGLHFFNPVSRMKLVEVVIANQTSEETRERSLAFARQIGKLPVIVRDGPGFLVNRVLFPYLLDAAELFQSGVDADKIDNALLQWGMPMGPLRLIDEIGVDIAVDIGNTLEKAYGMRDHVPTVLLWLRDGQMLGRKANAGFYKYEAKTQTPNDALEKWRRSDASSLGSRQTIGEGAASTLSNRLIFLMVNEAARCVEENIVDSPENADYGMILGIGFAPFRGGPLRFAEHFGLKEIVEEMERLAQSEEKFAPCEILKKHARDGTRFYEN